VVWLALLMVAGVALSITTAVKMASPSKISKARSALEQGRLPEAEKMFRALSRPRHWGRQHEQACYGLGQALEQRGQVDQAIEVYDKYLYRYERTGRGTKRIIERIRSRRDALVRELNARTIRITNNYAASHGKLIKRQPLIKVRESGHGVEGPKCQVRAKPSNDELLDIFGSESPIAVADETLEPIRTDHHPEKSDQVLDRYLLGEKLGEGGFGEVYQGYLPVAIKIAKNPALIDNLKRLGVLQSKVNSARIVAPIEVNLENDPPFVVMEHIDGPDMRNILSAYDGLAPADALHLMHEIALGLSDAHKVGVLHLDLKPENVLVSADGEVKLTDFELGRDQSEGAKFRMSQSLASIDGKNVQGTVAYMSPEQRVGKKLDARSDIYTAGIMLFEALTGELPQPGDKPSQFVANLPASIDQIFERCFVRYERRYQSSSQLAQDLQQALSVLAERPNLKKLVRDSRLADRAALENAPASAKNPENSIVERRPVQLPPQILAGPKEDSKESPKISVKGEGGKEYLRTTSFQERYSPSPPIADPKAETLAVPVEAPGVTPQPTDLTVEIPPKASSPETLENPEAPKRQSLDSLIASRAKNAKAQEVAPRVPINKAIEIHALERLENVKATVEEIEQLSEDLQFDGETKERPDRTLEAG
jgi:serine/threonine protein kinase